RPQNTPRSLLFNCNKTLLLARSGRSVAPSIIAATIASAALDCQARKNGCEQRLADGAPEPIRYAQTRETAMTGLAAVIAAAVSWAVLGALLRRPGFLPLDVPNARSLHVHAIPRGGGLAIWAGWLAG